MVRGKGGIERTPRHAASSRSPQYNPRATGILRVAALVGFLVQTSRRQHQSGFPCDAALSSDDFSSSMHPVHKVDAGLRSTPA